MPQSGGHIRSLYVHFPFCEAKCHYCDFYSIGVERTQAGDADQFEAALHREASLTTDQLAPELDTIFFGGGTPSMTPVESMKRALAPLRLQERVTEKTEWTMEANPSSVSLESLRQYREFGVNRISMGVQALRPDLLVNLGRVHSREAAFRALDAIFEAGFTNASVDLLCGVPGQTERDIEDAMTLLTNYPITHLSCYLLTLHKTHRMYGDLPDEDVQLSHLLLIDRFMKSKGFEHYEISNFARPGRRAQHNLKYWTGASYLGLGPSAHSFDQKALKRWKNVSSLHLYGSRLNEGTSIVEWTEELNADQQHLEKWMLALRLDEGFPRSWLETNAQKARAETLICEAFLESHPTKDQYLRLTPKGFALSDQVISTLS
ncbi:MAG: radical SAM family heme chaperone HemW [Methylotenera sp.]|nr:radical SAM family heme chaperone HemW [Oligoflexia bacterium]